jgi:homogentisate 1,2-dioxygenase
MAFMFETPVIIKPTRFALESGQLQNEYFQCWQNLANNFTPETK